MVAVTFVTNDPERWGNGIGRPLAAPDADRNIWELKNAVEDLIANPPSPVQIASFEVIGASLIVHLTNGNAVGPLALPVATWRWRDTWTLNAEYLQLDVFRVDDTGIFLVLKDHTSPSSGVFDPSASSGGDPLYKQLFGISTIAVPLNVAVFFPGVQPSNALARVMMTEAGQFPANFAGSYVSAGSAGEGDTTYLISINEVLIGFATFLSSAEAMLTSIGGVAHSFAAGDFIDIAAPSVQDATLADIAFGLKAIKTFGASPGTGHAPATGGAAAVSAP